MAGHIAVAAEMLFMFPLVPEVCRKGILSKTNTGGPSHWISPVFFMFSSEGIVYQTQGVREWRTDMCEGRILCYEQKTG